MDWTREDSAAALEDGWDIFRAEVTSPVSGSLDAVSYELQLQAWGDDHARVFVEAAGVHLSRTAYDIASDVTIYDLGRSEYVAALFDDQVDAIAFAAGVADVLAAKREKRRAGG